MGSRECWLDLAVVNIEENDGAAFLRHGPERSRTIMSIEQAIAQYGSIRIHKLLRDQIQKIQSEIDSKK